VFLVLIEHWFDFQKQIEVFGYAFPAGQFGVNLFFVLSGFLIGGGLLRDREKIESGHAKFLFFLKNFYVRRILRIFPLFFLVTLIMIAVDFEGIARDVSPWLLSQTVNIGMFFFSLDVGHFAHYWTLAVEEQFYFLIPVLLLLLPRKFQPGLIFILIATATFVILLSYFLEIQISQDVLLVSNCDMLGMGILAAYIHHNKIRIPAPGMIAAIGIPLTFVFSVPFIADSPEDQEGMALLKLPAAISYASLMLYCAGVNLNLFSRITLTNHAIVWIGKISYGIYLIHNFIRPLRHQYFPELIARDSILLAFLFDFSIVVTLAGLSFHLFESPVNSLKKFFRDREG